MRSPIMKHFSYSHLPDESRPVVKRICDLAYQLDDEVRDGAEKSAGLRKLIEAKDCFVRATLE
jgi:hypothetical protein